MWFNRKRTPSISIEEIKKIKLEPGEILVVKCDQRLRQCDKEYISRELSAIFAGHKIVFLDSGYDLEAIKKGKLMVDQVGNTRCSNCDRFLCKCDPVT